MRWKCELKLIIYKLISQNDDNTKAKLENYVQSDILLMVDVVNNYRAETRTHYGLEALHYFSAPGM